MYQEIQKIVKNKKIEICKKNTKIYLNLIKNIKKGLFFDKNCNSFQKNQFFIELKENKEDCFSYVNVFQNDKLIKQIYPFYPHVSSQSNLIKKFCFDDITFSILPPSDALHFELIKYCDLHNLDLIIIFCDFNKKYMTCYLDYLYSTLKSHFLLINKKDFYLVFKRGLFCNNQLQLIKKDCNFFCNKNLFDLIYKKMK